MRIIIVAGAILLSGCSQMSPSAFYTKEGDQAELSKEKYLCERDARTTPGDACLQIHMFEHCMRSKGFKPVPDTGNKWLCGSG